MDRNQAKALLPIIQAYAEGKEIEIFDCTKKNVGNSYTTTF